ncbi:MAG: hypothetical protein FWH57_08595 [Oscillospiraceae bacterium]|nr:hypothetical protein [Oscillospiraceae bacterium]
MPKHVHAIIDNKTAAAKTANKKRAYIIIVAAILSALVAGLLLVCFFTLDMLPAYTYMVSAPNIGAGSVDASDARQIINVKMKIRVPVFSKKDSVYLFLGDKNIAVNSLTDAWGKTKEAFISEEGIITIPVSRGSTTNIDYDVSVSLPAKHGSRGAVTDIYTVFDGDQTFLLPAEFNLLSEEGVRNAVGRLNFAFDFPNNWEKIIPFTHLSDPGWMDIYSITKNAFVAGEFYLDYSTQSGLKVYSLEHQAADQQTTSQLTPEDMAGFDSLYAYYLELFGSAPEGFNIVLLPPDRQIIGGSGTGVVAASFDPNSIKDWQLLSHRMFHAFYDTVAPYINVHVEPNMWLNEGLATYYEKLAMDALPEPLKLRLGADFRSQMALTFSQYLYMRLKEPFQYNFAPMDEERLTSSSMTEFLHYTAAPLIVMLFERESANNGNPPDSLLRYCLDSSAFEGRVTALEAALDLLGDEGVGFCDDYLLGMNIPPLWYLEAYQPSSEEVLEALNYIETMLASWRKTEIPEFEADVLSMEELRELLASSDESGIPVLSDETGSLVKSFSPELYAIIKRYYQRAQQMGFDLDDRELRLKMQ